MKKVVEDVKGMVEEVKEVEGMVKVSCCAKCQIWGLLEVRSDIKEDPVHNL